MASSEPQYQVSEPPKMDLESYICNYKGRTRIHRLIHIGKTSAYYSTDAFKYAISEAKKGIDVDLYRRAVESSAIAVSKGTVNQLDQDWIDQTKVNVDRETSRLEAELKGYKNNLIKESIRMGYDDLGKHLYASGDMADSQKTFYKEREFCQSPAHITQMNLQLISVLIDQRAWHSVELTAQRLKNMPSKPGTEREEAKISAVLGLAAMSQHKYADAASYLLSVHIKMLEAHLDDPSDSGTFNDVLTPNDVATYGALCSLASMDRAHLQSDVLDNSTFRAFLELEPHLRRAISAFISGRYAVTLSLLESYRSDFLLDIYLQPHLNSLYHSIRSKATIEYSNAFSCISLTDLEQVVGAEEKAVVNIVIDLIKSGELNARLDLEHGIISVKSVDKRRRAQADALQVSENYQKTAQMRIFRMEMILAGLEVRPPLKADPNGRMEIDGANISSRLGAGWRRS